MSIFLSPQTSEPYKSIGHTIDSKSLVWILMGKSRFLALINIENWALHCCLPTPMTLGESDVPACGPPASWSVHLASSAVTPAGSVHKSRGDNVVCMQLKRWCVWMLQRGHSGDGCVLASTLCKYDLRKGDLFVLSRARVRRVRRGRLSSELLVCGRGVRSILFLPLVARCLETIDVCIWRMFVFMSVVVTVWGSVGMFQPLYPHQHTFNQY